MSNFDQKNKDNIDGFTRPSPQRRTDGRQASMPHSKGKSEISDKPDDQGAKEKEASAVANDDRNDPFSLSERSKFAVVIICAVLILYITYHVVSAFTPPLQYAHAAPVTEYDNVYLDGIIVRDENVLSSSTEGRYVYLTENGSRVSSDTALVGIDSTLEAASDDLSVLKRRANVLKHSTPSFESSEFEANEADFSELYASFARSSSKGNLSVAMSVADSFMTSLNKKEAYADPTLDYKAIYDMIDLELSQFDILSENAEIIKSQSSCYYYHSIDGFEDLLSYDDISSLTIDNYDSALEAVLSADHSVKATASPGKTVENFVWYFTTVVDNTVASNFEVGMSYPVLIGESISVEFVLDQVTASDERTLIIFSCGDIPSEFDFVRYQTVKVTVGSCTGLQIPSSALHYEGDYVGVYVLSGGGFAHFKRIDILRKSMGYLIVSTEPLPESELPDAESTTEGDATSFVADNAENVPDYISENDIIIVSRGRLYDGKAIPPRRS